jgi:hypothetical protein
LVGEHRGYGVDCITGVSGSQGLLNLPIMAMM